MSMTSTRPPHRKDEYESDRDQLAREQKALDRILGGSGCCLICFISDPLILEEHHPAGRKHSDLTFTVCANHHTLLSRKQRSWPTEWLEPDLPIEKRTALMVLAMSEMLHVAFEEMWTGLEFKKRRTCSS